MGLGGEFGDEDVVAAFGAKRIAAEVDGAVEIAGEPNIVVGVDGGTCAFLVLIVAKALGPDG